MSVTSDLVDPYLTSIIAPEQAALLVIDVQNDFCHQDGLFGKLGLDMTGVQNAARQIEALLPIARQSGVLIIFVMMEHDPSTNSVAWVNRSAVMRRDACVAGTWGAEFYVIAPQKGEPIIVKNRYSPFVGTNIEYLLRARECRTLLVTGVATNICLEAVLRDGFNRDYNVVLVEDCAGAYSERAQQSTIENTRAFLGRVVRSQTLRESWSSRPLASKDRSKV